jgi:hypothetical protein
VKSNIAFMTACVSFQQVHYHGYDVQQDIITTISYYSSGEGAKKEGGAWWWWRWREFNYPPNIYKMSSGFLPVLSRTVPGTPVHTGTSTVRDSRRKTSQITD